MKLEAKEGRRSMISNAPKARWRAIRATLLLVTMVAVPSAVRAQATVDHKLFDALLGQHVRDGFVDYDAFARDPAFGHYLASLDRVRPATLDEDERLAFWINVYNAFTIQLIVTF